VSIIDSIKQRSSRTKSEARVRLRLHPIFFTSNNLCEWIKINSPLIKLQSYRHVKVKLEAGTDLNRWN